VTLYIGCDLGGTNIKAGIVNLEEGSVLHADSIPTNSQDGHDAVMERMADLLHSLISESGMDQSELLGIGVSAPGVIDLKNGTTLFLPNLSGQWRNVPLGNTLSAALNLPVTLLNDVRAITYGEYIYGAGQGVNRMACFAIGTGVGGGLVLNGELLLGFQGTAGEFGHQTVEINGLRCSCGNYGCLEAYTSGPAIASRAEKAVRQGFTTLIAEMIDHDLNKITPEIVARAAEEGDEIAQEIWDSVGHYLGTGIANICVAFGPERVVLTGGVAAAGDLLLKPIKKTLQERVFVMPIKNVEVVLSSLGTDAGILGMASWASSKQSQFI
jgi:glucokinase